MSELDHSVEFDDECPDDSCQIHAKWCAGHCDHEMYPHGNRCLESTPCKHGGIETGAIGKTLDGWVKQVCTACHAWRPLFRVAVPEGTMAKCPHCKGSGVVPFAEASRRASAGEGERG